MYEGINIQHDADFLRINFCTVNEIILQYLTATENTDKKNNNNLQIWQLK